VSENRVLKRIFESKKEEVAGGWRRLHNEELDIYSSADIIKVIKSRRMRLMGHVAHVREMIRVYKIPVKI
jgi:hypothetical protein